MQLVIYALIVLFCLLIWKTKYIDAGGAIASALLISTSATWGADRIGDPLILLLVYGAIVAMTTFKRIEKKRIYERVTGHERKHSLRNVMGKLALPVLMSILHQREVFIAVIGYGIADSAGSQLGVLSRSHPRIITSFRPVTPGTNGAISSLGTILGVMFAFCIGILYSVFTGFPFGKSIFEALLGGLIGNFIDSILGATLETKLYSDDWITNLLTCVATILIALLSLFLF